MRKLLMIAGLVAFALPAMAQDTPTRVTPDTLTWKENPAFPKGVQIATLVGDPTKAGDVVVLRIKFPPNFQMPPHTHPYSEVVTVISGNIGSLHGDKFEKKGEELLELAEVLASIPVPERIATRWDAELKAWLLAADRWHEDRKRLWSFYEPVAGRR